MDGIEGVRGDKKEVGMVRGRNVMVDRYLEWGLGGWEWFWE